MIARPRRVLVTGASGFIGSHLSRAFIAHGDDVALLLRNPGAAWRIRDLLARTRVLRGDLSDLDAVRADIRDFRADLVVHAGWQGVRPAEHDRLDHVKVNVMGSTDLMILAQSAGCASWIGLGSQWEYERREGPVRETDPTLPDTAYGAAKLSAYVIARQLCEAAGTRLTWFRLSSSYGPAESSRRLIPSTILSLLRRRRPALTSGEQVWDYLYVDDLVRAIVAAEESGCEGVYNLGSGESHTIASIALKIRDMIDPSLDIGLGEVPHPAAGSRWCLVDVSRLMREARWEPQIGLNDGLSRSVEWFRRNLAEYLDHST